METTEKLPRPRAARMLMGCGILLVATLGSAMLTHGRPLSASSVVNAAMVTALGVFAMAALMAPVTPYPRWAHWASAAVLAGWVLASPWIAGSPDAWRADATTSLWLMPWFLMMTASTSRRSAEGLCATHGRRAAWILVAMNVVLGAVLVFAGRIGRAL